MLPPPLRCRSAEKLLLDHVGIFCISFLFPYSAPFNSSKSIYVERQMLRFDFFKHYVKGFVIVLKNWLVKNFKKSTRLKSELC